MTHYWFLNERGNTLTAQPAAKSAGVARVRKVARMLARETGARVLVVYAPTRQAAQKRLAHYLGVPFTLNPPRTARRPASSRASKRRRIRAAARRGKRRNPAAPPASAARTFKMWHGFPPDSIERVRVTREIPRTLVKLGELVEVVYRSDKWTGKPRLYQHRTAKPHPQLCTGPNGRGLYLVGGRTVVTARGLVH